MRKLGLYMLAGSMMAGTALTSCSSIQNANNTQKGAAAGAAAGAVLGGVVGNNVKNKNSALGAVLGGVVGGTVGAIIGRNMDKQAQEIETAILNQDRLTYVKITHHLNEKQKELFDQVVIFE
mgnify:CR=1 FL=1